MKKIIQVLGILLFYGIAIAVNGKSMEDRIGKAMAGDHRDPENAVRDIYRHPKETLMFMGIKPGLSVVEIWPSTGWYTEILAPVLRERNIYFAAGFAMTADRTPEWRKDVHKKFMEKLEQRSDIYDHVVVTELSVPERTTIAPPDKVDMVLTFRNVHNWMNGDYAEDMFKVFARVLKTGGILGVVEHRAKPGISVAEMKKSGYITEEHVIALARSAGFELEAKSEINANPDDSKDHPAGVWTLPPSLRYCRSMEDSPDRAKCFSKYRAIGESDRMTLRFRKR